MDHKWAETRQSVEKYTLNELSPDERDQFEDHMFDCPICSEQVRQNFIVTENLKEVLLEAPLEHRVTWRDWFRVPSLVPTFAAIALACVVGYHGFGTAPGEMAAVLPQMTPLKTASRGPVPVVQVDRKSPVFVLSVNADQLMPGAFECELDDATGTKVVSSLKGQKNPDVALVQIQFPTRSMAVGRHTLTLRADGKPGDPITYTFDVQDSH